RDAETRKRPEVEPTGRFKRSNRDRWTQDELGPQQASSDDSDDSQEEELQAAQRDGGPVAHSATADVKAENSHMVAWCRPLASFGRAEYFCESLVKTCAAFLGHRSRRWKIGTVDDHTFRIHKYPRRRCKKEHAG